MLATYACTLLILAASLVLGRALLTLFGDRRPSWLAGAVGFAALVTITPFLIRLPGRATTAAILVGLAIVAAIVWIRAVGGRSTEPPQHGREDGAMHGRESGSVERPPTAPHATAIAALLLVVAVASLPFLFNDQLGVLGEGIYTNDHAAQLFWADWLQHGFGPEPSGVRFGYPVGPQAVAAVAAQSTGADLVEAFNGLLLAIPALTALTALAALGGLAPGRRIVVVSLTALPYLAVSFLAQSAFKETAMALFVLAFALCLSRAGGEATDRAGASRMPTRALIATLVVLAAAAVFTYSLPGLAWFALALPLWLGLELLAGRRPIDLQPARELIARHRVAAAATAAVAIAAVAVAVGPATAFIERIDEVQASAGRLSSPVFPGEVFGVWPEGDFRLVRGDVSGAIPATLLGLLAAAVGVLALMKRRDGALLAMLVAGAVVYVGARLVAEIHVEAKALGVMAPLVLLVSLRALLAPGEPGEPGPLRLGRHALGVVFVLAAAGSTILALRATPVGFDDRARGLERLGERIEGESVAFLGVDRFGGYRLRGTLVRSPGGYVPAEVASRPEKTWQQGLAMDHDTLASYKLDQFDYAITTTAAYQSTPPPNMERVADDGDYVLLRRAGPTPRSRVLEDEGGDPGARLVCTEPEGRRIAARDGEATVLTEPVVTEPRAWRGPERVTDAAAGQEDAFLAPASTSQTISLGPGEWALSLQYHSQVPLTVEASGVDVELPPSLDGMYLTSPGEGSFWPVGEVTNESALPLDFTVTVRAAEPNGLQDALGVERRVWLGRLAASRLEAPRTVAVGDACSRYVDRFTLRRKAGGGAG